MAVLTLTNLDTSDYASTFGLVPVGGTRSFQITTAQLLAALSALNTKVDNGTLNYCTSTDPSGMAQGGDAINYIGKATVRSLVAESQTISGDITVDDITADAIACASVAATASVGTVNLTATGAIATVPVIVLFAASPYTAAAKPSFLCDATGGAIVFNLPAASAIAGRRISVKKTDVSVNAVTVTRAGSDTIDGANTKVLTAQYDFIELESDGVATWTVYANKLT